MKKRKLAAFLWFLVGWQGGGLLVGLLALPGLLAFVPGVAMAVLVLWDPIGLFVARAPKGRQITPINEYAAALDRKADRHLDKRIEQWPAVEAESKRA